MIHKTRYITTPVFAVVVAMFGVVAIASGSIPSDDQVISGCFVKATGALRVIDADAAQKCKASEASLSWNQVGLKGEPGDIGPAGPAGEQGPAGVSGAEVYFSNGGPTTVNGVETLVNMEVPAGRYLAEARFTAGVESSGTSIRDIACDVSEGGGAFDTGKTSRLGSTDPYLQYEMTAVIDHPDASTPVKILCSTTTGGVSVPSATLLLTKVAPANGSGTSG